MRYPADFGHRDFLLAIGFGAKHIVRYLLECGEAYSNNFVIDQGEASYCLPTDVAGRIYCIV